MTFIPHAGPRLSLLLLGCCMLAVVTSNASRAQRDNPYTSLKLFAKVDKDSYVVGEPVYLTVQLRNTGSSPVRVFKRLKPDDGFIIVHLTAPDGGPAGFAPLGVNDTAAQMEELRPGAEVGAVFPLFYGAMGWTFPRPGTYKEIVTYRLPRPKQEPEETKSEALTINVSQDKTGAGTFLLERGPAATEAGKFLLWESGDHLRRGIGRLESLIEKFPDSPLPDYARFALGRNQPSL